VNPGADGQLTSLAGEFFVADGARRVRLSILTILSVRSTPPNLSVNLHDHFPAAEAQLDLKTEVLGLAFVSVLFVASMRNRQPGGEGATR
jgi:hypothetical protein